MASKMTFVLTQIDKGSPEDPSTWNVKLEIESGDVVFDDINIEGRNQAIEFVDDIRNAKVVAREFRHKVIREPS